MRRLSLAIAVRYGAVGVANTLIGYTIIVAALWLGAGDYLANALGYGLGLWIAYLLHRRWTFRVSHKRSLAEVIRFYVSAGISYAANIGFLTFARSLGYVDHPLAQLAAMGVYSLTFLIIVNLWVFTHPDKPAGKRP
jgi:putative flippase GtrA